ncbi:hypothetical protein IPH25_00915 [bacterium]|nr:MAG: hypothetical protein IPG37_03035 [bacterium]QQR61987.1 MAG: hypothetical protein IPH25_00915 [bacterium]QQR62420.1 MAG: hypothetical protein IPH67_03245 [bacterium]
MKKIFLTSILVIGVLQQSKAMEGVVSSEKRGPYLLGPSYCYIKANNLFLNMYETVRLEELEARCLPFVEASIDMQSPLESAEQWYMQGFIKKCLEENCCPVNSVPQKIFLYQATLKNVATLFFNQYAIEISMPVASKLRDEQGCVIRMMNKIQGSIPLKNLAKAINESLSGANCPTYRQGYRDFSKLYLDIDLSQVTVDFFTAEVTPVIEEYIEY